MIYMYIHVHVYLYIVSMNKTCVYINFFESCPYVYCEPAEMKMNSNVFV